MFGEKKIDRKSGLQRIINRDDLVYKLCSKCKEYKLLNTDNYSIYTHSKCGYKSQCKKCTCITFEDPDYYKKKNFNKEGLLICKICNIYKKEDDFNINDRNPIRNYRSRECKECESIRKSTNRKKRIPTEDLKEHLKRLLIACKTRTKGSTKRGSVRGKEINIDLAYLEKLYTSQKGICKISGEKMGFVRGAGKNDNNISVDRIDNSIGYLKGNIQLVCARVNIMRGNLTSDEFIKMCTKIYTYNENRDQKIQ